MSNQPFKQLIASVIVLFSLMLAACQPIQALPASQSSAMAAAATDEDANRAVVQRFYDEVFTQKKMAVLDEVFDPNLVRHDLDVGGELPGGGLEETLVAFPDAVATINQWVVEGDLVTAYVTYNGTHQAEFLGVLATGKAVTWSIIDIFRVKDGKVVELWHNIPNADILAQINPQTKMTTILWFHEVEDGERWANAWKKGTPGNRHEELFADVATIRTFRDPENHNLTGGIMEIPDMEKFQALMASEEAIQAAADDGVKYDTLRVLVEFTP